MRNIRNIFLLLGAVILLFIASTNPFGHFDGIFTDGAPDVGKDHSTRIAFDETNDHWYFHDGSLWINSDFFTYSSGEVYQLLNSGFGVTNPSAKLHTTTFRVENHFFDGSNQVGNNKQILWSTGSGTEWEYIEDGNTFAYVTNTGHAQNLGDTTIWTTLTDADNLKWQHGLETYTHSGDSSLSAPIATILDVVIDGVLESNEDDAVITWSLFVDGVQTGIEYDVLLKSGSSTRFGSVQQLSLTATEEIYLRFKRKTGTTALDVSLTGADDLAFKVELKHRL